MTNQGYFRTVIRRENPIGRGLRNFALLSAPYCRLLIEVFIRKNFGRRYFNLGSAIAAAITTALFPTMALIPIVAGRNPDIFKIIWVFGGWFFFIYLFIRKSIDRNKEVEKGPPVINFETYSLSSGFPQTWYTDFLAKYFIKGKKVTIREIETYYEPLPFFLGGLLLTILLQPLGVFLMFISIMYSLSYRQAYKEGDDYILDIGDEYRIKKDLKENMPDNPNGQFKSGFTSRFGMPATREGRELLGDLLTNIPHNEATPAR
jgi:hypothetical protein